LFIVISHELRLAAITVGKFESPDGVTTVVVLDLGQSKALKEDFALVGRAIYLMAPLVVYDDAGLVSKHVLFAKLLGVLVKKRLEASSENLVSHGHVLASLLLDLKPHVCQSCRFLVFLEVSEQHKN